MHKLKRDTTKGQRRAYIKLFVFVSLTSGRVQPPQVPQTTEDKAPHPAQPSPDQYSRGREEMRNVTTIMHQKYKEAHQTSDSTHQQKGDKISYINKQKEKNKNRMGTHAPAKKTEKIHNTNQTIRQTETEGLHGEQNASFEKGCSKNLPVFSNFPIKKSALRPARHKTYTKGVVKAHKERSYHTPPSYLQTVRPK